MNEPFDWCIVGAGLGGIFMIARLLDKGIPANQIVWIDPEYKVGDLGKYWQKVQSNTDVRILLNCFQKSSLLALHNFNQRFKLQDADPDATVPLSQVVEPLQLISDNLKQQVNLCPGMVSKLSYQAHWRITLQDTQELIANNVVLSIGSEPNGPLYNTEDVIPLTIALDPEKITSHVNGDDTVLVFGSSHSAILVMKNIIDAGVGHIINIYRRDLIYAEKIGNKIKYDNTGLKGIAADWAKSYVETESLANLSRVHIDAADMPLLLGQSTKQVYATGFQRRKNIITNTNLNQYDVNTGCIAPHLYGTGIAYPLLCKDSFGIEEYRVGLDSCFKQSDLIIDGCYQDSLQADLVG